MPHNSSNWDSNYSHEATCEASLAAVGDQIAIHIYTAIIYTLAVTHSELARL